MLTPRHAPLRRPAHPVARAARRGVAALALLTVPVVPAAAGPAAGATYRWHGELVARTSDAVTLKARVVSRDGLATAHTLRDGDPIVVTWSGLGDRADGIRAVAADPQARDRFRLPATLVAADPTTQYLTFRVAATADGLRAAAALAPGAWVTATATHGADTAAPVVAVAPFGAAHAAMPAGCACDRYQWHAALVGVEAATRTLTLRARAVAPAGLAGATGLLPGAPIEVTWSGTGHHADGIRGVEWAPARADRFLLAAAFVGADPVLQQVTVTVPATAASLTAARALARDTWVTVTSPHRPGATPAVTALRAFGTAAAAAPAPADGYQWHAALVGVDERHGTLTLRARLVARQTMALERGAPVMLEWSGFGARADGIRLVRPNRAAARPFALRATFVAADHATQYLTFTVPVPTGTPQAATALLPGDWVTVTSPQGATEARAAVVLLDAYDTAQRARRYTWPAELVAFDAATGTVAVSAPVEPHVLRYLDRFAAGEEVVLIWAPASEDTVTAVRYLEPRAGSVLDHGYVLPVTFTAAEAGRQRIRFRTAVPAHTHGLWAALPAGTPIAVTTLFDQGGETAAILAVDAPHPL